MSKEHAAIIRFQMVIDDAEAGKKEAQESLRLICKEVCNQAPIEDIVKMADLVLRMQRQAYQQNKSA